MEIHVLVRNGIRQYARARDLGIQFLKDIEDDRMRLTLSILGQYANDRGEAVTILALNNKPIDAEILLRTYQEAYIRMMFLTLSPKAEWTGLLDEFWIDSKLDNLSRHLKTSEELSGGGFQDLVADIDIELLDSGTLDELRAKRSAKDRNNIRQKWGFTNLLRKVAASLDQKGVPRETIEMHSRLYGVASSLGHADELALNMLLSNLGLDNEEQGNSSSRQIARITGDLMDIPALFAMCLAIILEKETVELEDLQKASEEVHEQILQFVS